MRPRAGRGGATVARALEDSGYQVVLNKIGTGPLDQCTVDSVRPGETVTRPVHNGPGDDMVNQIVYQTVYLTANC